MQSCRLCTSVRCTDEKLSGCNSLPGSATLNSIVQILIPLLVGFLITQISTLTTSAYLHRALAHKAVRFHPALALFLRFFLWLTTGVKSREWAAVHRKHHAFTDEESDPHSPAQLGWIRVQLTNFWLYRNAANDPVTVQKWGRDLAPARWDRVLFDRGMLGLGTSTLLLCIWLGWWQGVLAFSFHVVSYVVLSGAVNAVGHTFGRRPFANSATNLHWLAALTSGEGYHNNHHGLPTSARFGSRPLDLDAAWWLIKVAEKMRLAEVRDVRAKKAPV